MYPPHHEDASNEALQILHDLRKEVREMKPIIQSKEEVIRGEIEALRSYLSGEENYYLEDFKSNADVLLRALEYGLEAYERTLKDGKRPAA